MACSEITENQQAEEIEVVDQHPFSAAACYGGWNGGSNIQ
jgi:hypothetical protein